MRKIQALERNCYLKAFVYGLCISFLLFIPFILVDEGLFLFYGDFNVQQVPFYQMCHDAVRSGNVKWSWTTDLGANFVGSYSFYLLGSPFFWLTIPFPSEAVPYLMGPASYTEICLRLFDRDDFHPPVCEGFFLCCVGRPPLRFFWFFCLQHLFQSFSRGDYRLPSSFMGAG